MDLLKDKKMIKILIAVMIAFVSMFMLSKITSAPAFHAGTIEALDQKRNTVMQLTAASTAASAAITAIPGDVGSPIATQLTEFSKYFLIVLSTIYLEKYLLTITCYIGFKWLIPIACGLYIASQFWHPEKLLLLAKKIAIFSVACMLVIPSSVKVSNMIEATYEQSITETIETAEKITVVVEENKNILEKLWDGITNTFGNIKDTITESVGNFMEVIVVMLVTSCLIPILVILCFIQLVKMIFGINISIPKIEPKKQEKTLELSNN